MKDRGENTYFDGIKISKGQKMLMVMLIAGVMFTQIDMYSFALLGPAIMEVWDITMVELGSVYSSFAVGAILGTFFIGSIADKKGRKVAFALACALAGVGALITCMAHNLTMLLIGRAFVGCGVISAGVVQPNYLLEMTPSDKRTKYQAIVQMIAIVGLPLSAALTKVILSFGIQYWRVIAAIPAMSLLVAVLTMFVLTESPRWLVTKGRVDEARRVFKRLTKQELNMGAGVASTTEKVTFLQVFQMMFSKNYIKKTIMFIVALPIACNAAYMFVQWMPTLLIEEGMSFAQATGYQQLVTTVALLGPVYVILFGDKGGKKIPYAIAMFIFSVGLIAVAVIGVSNTTLLTMALVIAGAFYFINYNFVGVYIGECYPTQMRVLVTAILIIMQKILNIFTNGILPPILYKEIGFAGYFICIAATHLLLAVLILYFGPRTAGRNLEEVSMSA